MKYKAVIFDFDMTLADSAKVIYVLASFENNQMVIFDRR